MYKAGLVKTLILFVLVVCSAQTTSAQWCGFSGPGQCTSPGLLTSGGFESGNLVQPIVNDSSSNAVIEILETDTLRVQGQYLIMDSMAIDSIFFLPEGLCWSSNKPNNTFHQDEDGCIKIFGVTCTSPGQYNAVVQMRVYLNLPIPLHYSGVVALRVINSGDVAPPIDTTGFAEGTAPKLIPYGGRASCWPTGIAATESNFSVKAFPNPFGDVTNIEVTGLSEKFGFELYDITGRLQQSISNVESNRVTVHKGELSNGVYLYRIKIAGKPVANGRLVVE